MFWANHICIHLKHKLTEAICIQQLEIFSFVLMEKTEKCVN